MFDLLKKYTNEQSRFMVINGTMIHYRDEGEGFPILLLHGAFSSLHTFDEWASDLSKRFRVVRLTYPGFGLTGPAADNRYHMSCNLDLINQFMDRMNISRFHVAGSSLGGWIAWEYALANPERVAKMVLIDAAGFLDDKSIPLPFKMARMPLFNRAIRYVVKRQVLEQFLRQVYCDKSKVTRGLVDRYYDLFTRKGNPEAFLVMANSHVKDHTLHLNEINTPTLILWGEDDKWLPAENARRFRDSIPNSRMIIYPRTGHVPMEEIPEDTLQDCQAFLSKSEGLLSA